MTDIQYILLYNAIKQTHFRKTILANATSVFMFLIGLITIIIAIIGNLKVPVSTGPILEFKIRFLLSFAGAITMVLGMGIKFALIVWVDNSDEQLVELRNVKKWCEENPEQEKNLDLSGPYSKEIHREFFEDDTEHPTE